MKNILIYFTWNLKYSSGCPKCRLREITLHNIIECFEHLLTLLVRKESSVLSSMKWLNTWHPTIKEKFINQTLIVLEEDLACHMRLQRGCTKGEYSKWRKISFFSVTCSILHNWGSYIVPPESKIPNRIDYRFNKIKKKLLITDVQKFKL